MGHWSEKVLRDVSRSLADKGIKIINEPDGRPEKLESVTLAKLIEIGLNNGFTPNSDTLDLSHTNHLPYRRITQGSDINQQADMQDTISWASPILELNQDQCSLSFYREGTPFLRSRDRPDLLVYPGTFDVERQSDPFIGEHIILSWSGSSSGKRRYKKETNANGPIVAEDQGETMSPTLGMEVSLNKSCDRLKEQLNLLQNMGSNNIAALLEHTNPCSAGELPTGTTILKSENKQGFHNSMKQIGINLFGGRSE